MGLATSEMWRYQKSLADVHARLSTCAFSQMLRHSYGTKAYIAGRCRRSQRSRASREETAHAIHTQFVCRFVLCRHMIATRPHRACLRTHIQALERDAISRLLAGSPPPPPAGFGFVRCPCARVWYAGTHTHTHELTDQRMTSRQSKIQFLSGLGFRVCPRCL